MKFLCTINKLMRWGQRPRLNLGLDSCARVYPILPSLSYTFAAVPSYTFPRLIRRIPAARHPITAKAVGAIFDPAWSGRPSCDLWSQSTEFPGVSLNLAVASADACSNTTEVRYFGHAADFIREKL